MTAPDGVLSHWSTLLEGLQQPPLEFYASVEAAIAKRNIADAKFVRIEYREGGAFSGFGQYLRIIRLTPDPPRLQNSGLCNRAARIFALRKTIAMSTEESVAAA